MGVASVFGNDVDKYYARALPRGVSRAVSLPPPRGTVFFDPFGVFFFDVFPPLFGLEVRGSLWCISGRMEGQN